MMGNPITLGKHKQFLRFVKDATDKALAEAGIDKDGLQRVIKNGDKFQADIIASIQKHSVSNLFADDDLERWELKDEEFEKEEREKEKLKSSRMYPKDYVEKIKKQIKALHKFFQNLGTADERIASRPLPPGAEGWFTIPRWEKIAPTYNEAVEKILAMISTDCNVMFYNRCSDQLSPQYLRQTAKTRKIFQKLGEEQNGHDILIVPAQLGLRHRGRSVRRARVVMNSFEFGLGAFAVGVILLIHLERLGNCYSEFEIGCAGDEYSPDANDRFDEVPVFGVGAINVDFETSRVDSVKGYSGSASGVRPRLRIKLLRAGRSSPSRT